MYEKKKTTRDRRREKQANRQKIKKKIRKNRLEEKGNFEEIRSYEIIK